eukprot:102608_1
MNGNVCICEYKEEDAQGFAGDLMYCNPSPVKRNNGFLNVEMPMTAPQWMPSSLFKWLNQQRIESFPTLLPLNKVNELNQKHLFSLPPQHVLKILFLQPIYSPAAAAQEDGATHNVLTIDAPNQYPSPCPSDNDEEEVKEDKKKPSTKKEIIKKNVKIAKHPQRAFLFKDVTFMEIFAKAVGNGIEDRSKETRDKTMKVLKKIEMTHNEIIERFIDPMHQKKYEKWKKYNAPKGKKGKRKRKRISPIKRAKTSKPNKLLLNKNTAGSKSHDVTTGSENEQPSIAITNDTANVVPNGTK